MASKKGASGQGYVDRYVAKREKIKSDKLKGLSSKYKNKADKRSSANVYSSDNFKPKRTSDDWVVGELPQSNKYMSSLMKATGDTGRSRTAGRARVQTAKAKKKAAAQKRGRRGVR